MSGLNLLHILIVLSAGACFYYALREAPRRTVRLRRLFLAPWAGTVAALLLAFFQLGLKQPAWPFAAALGLGLAVGSARGFMMRLEVDEYWLVVRPAGRRAMIWIGSAVAASAAIDIAGVLVGPNGADWRFAAALLVVGCVGALFGRALAMTTRVWRMNT
jgi:hypothetical protein